MEIIDIYTGLYSASKLAAQYFFCKLHTDFMGLFRRGLTRFKCLYQVAAQVCPLGNGMFAGPGKFNIGGFGGAAKGV